MKKLLILLLVVSPIFLSAQDYFFTQNSNSMTLSPSFTGITESGRVNIATRNNFGNNLYSTYLLSYDHYFDKINSGFGIYALRDQANGSGSLANTKIALNYAFQVKLFGNLKFRPGINLSYSYESLSMQNLIFSDQISPTGEVSGTSIILLHENAKYFDMDASVLFYTSRFWFGTTVSHLFMPNNSVQSFWSSEPISRNIFSIPIKTNIFAGYKFLLEESLNNDYEKSIIVSGNYSIQSEFSLLDLRTYFNWNIMSIGVGSRFGINELFNHFESYNSYNSIFAILGINFKNLNIGYSYDYFIANIGGYHEISLKYKLKNNKE